MQNLRRVQREILRAKWANEMLQFEAEEQSIKYKRLQMLRVTKEMQSTIRFGKPRDKQKEHDRQRLERQIKAAQESLEQKIVEKERIIRRHERQARRLMEENAALKGQKELLENVVREREQIFEMQTSAKDQNRMNRKMRELFMEKRLKELSKGQESELQFLRGEIDRLHERSFPSFAVVSRRRLQQQPTLSGQYNTP